MKFNINNFYGLDKFFINTNLYSSNFDIPLHAQMVNILFFSKLLKSKIIYYDKNKIYTTTHKSLDCYIT